MKAVRTYGSMLSAICIFILHRAEEIKSNADSYQANRVTRYTKLRFSKTVNVLIIFHV